MEASGGVIEIEVRVVGVTATFAEPCVPPNAPVMEVLPTPTPVTRPVVRVTLPTCAIPLLLEVQVASVVQSSAAPSLKLQVAVSCSEVPFAIESTGAVIVTEVR